MRLLRQKENNPLSLSEQVVTLVAAIGKVFLEVPVEEVVDKREKLLRHFHRFEPLLMQRIEKDKVLSDEDKAEIIRVAKEFMEDN